MAKVKTEGSGKYPIRENVLREGYYAKIDGKEFIVGKAIPVDDYNAHGMPVKKLVAKGIVTDGEATGNTYFENLTDHEFFMLAEAGVIELQGKDTADHERYQSVLSQFKGKKR